MQCCNITVLQLLQCCYNFAQHVSIVIGSFSGAYSFQSYKLMLRATHTAVYEDYLITIETCQAKL
jgi:hypothetical protein